MSIRPEILELIHADIDGVAGDYDRKRLQEAIANDPEVRAEYRRIRGLQDVLARVGREEPPARVVPEVMRAVRARGSIGTGGLMERLRREWPGGRVVARYAYAVAAGAILGIVGVHVLSVGGLFGPAAVPERDVQATLAPAPVASHLDLVPAGVHGTATLRPSPSGASVALDLTEETPVELLLRYDPAKGVDRVSVLVVRDGEVKPAGSLEILRTH